MEDQDQTDPSTLATVESDASTCFFRGNNNHPRSKCPACIVMQFAQNVSKRAILQKFAWKGRSARIKVQLRPGLLHLPQWVSPKFFQNHQELLTSKDWKSKPSLKALSIHLWKLYSSKVGGEGSSYCSSFFIKCMQISRSKLTSKMLFWLIRKKKQFMLISQCVTAEMLISPKAES